MKKKISRISNEIHALKLAHHDVIGELLYHLKLIGPVTCFDNHYVIIFFINFKVLLPVNLNHAHSQKIKHNVTSTLPKNYEINFFYLLYVLHKIIQRIGYCNKSKKKNMLEVVILLKSVK